MNEPLKRERKTVVDRINESTDIVLVELAAMRDLFNRVDRNIAVAVDAITGNSVAMRIARLEKQIDALDRSQCEKSGVFAVESFVLQNGRISLRGRNVPKSKLKTKRKPVARKK